VYKTNLFPAQGQILTNPFYWNGTMHTLTIAPVFGLLLDRWESTYYASMMLFGV